jgi:hypothetical protein
LAIWTSVTQAQVHRKLANAALNFIAPPLRVSVALD